MSEQETGFETRVEGGVLVLSFNRPAQGNALPAQGIAPLTELFRAIPTDSNVRSLLIRGEGKIFSAGGDVRGFASSLEQSPEARRADYGARLGRAATLIQAFLALEIPIVAACQGGVAGAGITYALGADLVLADETVKFVFAHQRIGLPPDGGVSLLLPRAVGERKAAELVLTAANVGADEALRIGLVSRLVPAEELQAQALAAAQRLAAGPQAVLRRAKALLREAPGRTPAAQLQAEREAVVESVGEADFEEGVRAFMEKRKAVFL